MKKIIDKINREQMKKKLPKFRVGDNVRVQVRIVEGDKERLQAYAGTVISKKGSGINTSIRVRRVSFGEGVERVFLVHSPRIDKIEVISVGNVHRAKLYYLRKRVGRRAKIDQTRGPGGVAEETSQTTDASQPDEPLPTPEAKIQETVGVAPVPTTEAKNTI